MERSNLKQYLEVLLSNQDVKNGKPDPEIYLTCCARLGLAPQECLIVEDNPNGIKAAYDSGAHVLEVQTVYDVNYQNIRAALDKANNNMKTVEKVA